MDKQAAHSSLLAFLGQRGRFVEEGFPITALTNSDAREFLTLLRKYEIRPLGIELWRKISSGYEVDGAKGWYSEAGSLEADYADALSYLSSGWLNSNDLFVVQY